MMDGEKLTTGLWKFSDNVGEKDLIELANEWAKDEKYMHLYIRKASRDQLGLGFTYITNGTREDYERYFNDTSDYLKRTFGNDLRGWDMADSTTPIKGF